jgi:hypothetical protein
LFFSKFLKFLKNFFAKRAFFKKNYEAHLEVRYEARYIEGDLGGNAGVILNE